MFSETIADTECVCLARAKTIEDRSKLIRGQPVAIGGIPLQYE